ncbi:MAG TPA: acyl-CoA dehydrogenase C-terminal domain-containing protein [Gemmatimonadaceae bacterium]|nr:acyl-CoA dehydrogenase C-terminal domain-containing protein [Gemmatimonadaceae bacterium]
MPTYKAPLDEIRFLLEEVHDVGQLAALPGYEDMTPDVLLTVLQEGARLCEEVLAPINQAGDAEGCRFEQGRVATPGGFKAAYDAYREGGWPAMTARPEFGGQGLPHLARFVFDEMLCSSNLSFSMYPGLAHGATALLERWGDDELRRRFLPKLVDGSWGGTMCLTEAHAGTDLGMIRTRAVPAGDGAYLVTGTKIFISSGEHDLTDNIIHLVLAKLPDAPPGTRGISLLLVPKLLPTEEGAAGTPNGVSCGSIEHKMGIKANSTCVMNFENARGWLVGEPHRGMRTMFTMMNGARLAVGMQGLGLAEVAYQNAVAYAKDRLQGRAMRGPQNPREEADPIVVHPDVRRMLMTMKAYIEGMRALAYWVGLLIDVAGRHPEAARREEAEDLLALMTPVIKGFCTDVGFEITNLALQCYGGHGYIREFGMEQFVRDARIAQIYEGTNGVQAMDLLGRKIPEGGGRLAKRFFALAEGELAAAAEDAALADIAKPVAEALRTLQRTTGAVMSRALQNPEEVGAAASEYLRLFGLVATGWMWVRLAKVAAAQGGARNDARLATARFYVARLLPQTAALSAQIVSGAGPVMALEASAL